MTMNVDTVSLEAYMQTAVNEAGCMQLRWYAGSTGPTAGKRLFKAALPRPSSSTILS